MTQLFGIQAATTDAELHRKSNWDQTTSVRRAVDLWVDGDEK
jgi:hypothetical protein